MSRRTPTAVARAGLLAGIAAAALLRVLVPASAEALPAPAVQARGSDAVENPTGLDACGRPNLLGLFAPERRGACDPRRGSTDFDPGPSVSSGSMAPRAPRTRCAAPDAVHERRWR